MPKGFPKTVTGLLMAAAVASLAPARARADAILDVNQSLLAAIRMQAASPPMASRDIAMVDVAMYDAVDATTGLQRQAFAYTGTAMSGLSPDAAAYGAGYAMLSDLFPSLSTSFGAAQSAATGALGLAGGQVASSTSFGAGVANGYFAARSTDGSASAQTPYTPGNQPGNYQFTSPTQTGVLLPGWGKVTPFGAPSLAAAQAPPLYGPGSPYPTEAAYLASAQFQSDFATVEAVGCKTCASTPDQRDIAAFWSDTNGNAAFKSTATPAGQWLDIADTVAGSAGLGLLDTAQLGAEVGASLADAAIVAWTAKSAYDFWRPDTAIAFTNGNRNWVPLWPDPLFQSYVSGHSTFSGAASEALAKFFGTDDVSFCSNADPNAHDANNQPLSTTPYAVPITETYTDTAGHPYQVTVISQAERCYSSFSSAAAEAGESRILGGIHFPTDNVEGLRSGAEAADLVAADNFATVPEPASAILGVPLAVLALLRRRRRPPSV